MPQPTYYITVDYEHDDGASETDKWKWYGNYLKDGRAEEAKPIYRSSTGIP